MSFYSVWNGEIRRNDSICISPDNRSFKYGDGCFETMKVLNGKLLLADLHFQRLFSSMQTLKFVIPPSITPAFLLSLVEELIKINGHKDLARVRLMVYSGDGNLYDTTERIPYYIIQSWNGSPSSNHLNETGLKTNIFFDAKKTVDVFSSLKSNNYLGYAMAAIWAREQGLDDCIVTNAFDRIAESTIANVFINSDGIIKTPSLEEGCVSGVMRKYLLGCFQSEGIPFSESAIDQDELFSASEVFLTNASFGIRWVSSIGKKTYNNSLSALIHKKFISPLFGTSTF